MPERKQEKIFLWLEGTVERYGLVLALGFFPQWSGKGLYLGRTGCVCHLAGSNQDQ